MSADKWASKRASGRQLAEAYSEKPKSKGESGPSMGLSEKDAAKDAAKVNAAKQSQMAWKYSNEAFRNKSRANEKQAGEAHLRAAAATSDSTAKKNHKDQAARHAEKAGDLWDESKHPRDENGKFT